MRINPLSHANLEAIVRRDGGNGWTNNPHTWAWILAEAEVGARVVLVAGSGDEVHGYGSLVWRSAHLPFAGAGIPEVHDLVTARSQRGKGVATSLIAKFEQIAIERGCRAIGLGVGLYADYGPAQRLYASLGYVPDGRGVTYRNQTVVPGSSWPVDDDLLLWMTKRLS